MPLSGLTSFHSIAKIAPRMHQNSSFWAQKSEKIFWGGGTAPSPDLSPVGRGTPPPIPFGASILAPTALETRAFGACPPGFSRLTTGSWGASWNTDWIKRHDKTHYKLSDVK